MITLLSYCYHIGARIEVSGRVDPENKEVFCNLWITKNGEHVKLYQNRCGGPTIFGRSEDTCVSLFGTGAGLGFLEALDVTAAGEDFVREVRGKKIFFDNVHQRFNVPEDLVWE